MKKLASILLTLAIMATMMSATLADVNIPSPVVTELPGAGGAVGKILGAIQWVGYIFAVGMLLYIGIKYMMSAANEKADLKKGSINYVIGAVVVAAASTICGWFADFGDSLE